MVSFGPERCDAVYDRTRDLISEETGISYSISYNFLKSTIESFKSLPIEKTLIIYNTDTKILFTIRLLILYYTIRQYSYYKLYSLSQLLIRIKMATTIIYL